jgi:hypothetical protein
MPHLRCVPCRRRFQCDARVLTDVREPLCPACDAPLDPVGDLGDLVGFQRSALEVDRDFLVAVAMALKLPTAHDAHDPNQM